MIYIISEQLFNIRMHLDLLAIFLSKRAKCTIRESQNLRFVRKILIGKSNVTEILEFVKQIVSS